jgi:hypothetical protein
MKSLRICQQLAAMLFLVSSAAAAQDAALQMRVNELHVLISRFYIDPATSNLLTRLDLSGKPLFVPGLRESPSIEDASLCGGMYLDALVERYEVAHKPGAEEEARRFYRGIILNATVSPSSGLLARGTHPDKITYWGNPSVDQYTGVIFGLWRYYHSSLASTSEKDEIRRVILAMLRRFERDSWMLLDEDGDATSVWDLGYLDPTRAERLLSFLLVGYDLTRDAHWLRLYEQKKRTRLALCANYDVRDAAGRPYPAWVQLQNGMALRILLDLARDAGDLQVYRRGARSAIQSGLPQLSAYKRLVLDSGRRMTRNEMMAAKLWGEGPLTQAIRNPFDEITTILLLGDEQFYDTAMEAYREMMRSIDFSQLRTIWMTYPGEYNYWLAVRRGLAHYDPGIDLETQTEAYRMLRQDGFLEAGNGAISLR